MKASKNWKDGIISYFNTKDCLGFFSYSKGKYDLLSWLINKSIQHFPACLLFPTLLKMYPTVSGEHSELKPDKYPNPSPAIWEKPEIPEFYHWHWSGFQNPTESNCISYKANRRCNEWEMGTEGDFHAINMLEKLWGRE